MALRLLASALLLALTIANIGCHHHRGCCKRSCCPTTCCGYLDTDVAPPATLGAPR